MSHPLRAFMDVERRELPFALLMSVYFFLVIATFWILKPLKKSLFVRFYDVSGFNLGAWHMNAAQAEQLAKVLNMLVAIVAVAAFTWLARRFRRQQLTFIFAAFFVAAYFAYARLLLVPGGLGVWSFYLFGDLWATLMVATFFAFLNDSVSSSSAKRLYGLVGFGGVAGGVFGSTTVRGFIDQIDLPQWLWICGGIGLLIVGVAFVAGGFAERLRPADAQTGTSAPTVDGGNPALEGARLVLRSPYLLSIVAIVGLYEIVSTILDFQFTATIAHYLSGAAIDRQFATIFTITNWTSMLVQFFLTSFVMTRFGLMAALLVLPLAVVIGSAGFLALPILWVGSLLNTADNGFSYSINQSAKEALYVPTTRDEKYKAKAFIDMFVQRFAKSVAVGINLLVSTIFLEFASLRWLSVFTLGIVVIWILAARNAGRHFAQRERAETAAP